MRCLFFLLPALCLLRCATASDPSSEPDVGDAGAADELPVRRTVTVGTGRDRFESLVAGQTIELVTGPQGGGRFNGFHIWIGLRSTGFDPVGATVMAEILDGESREARAQQVRVLPLEPSAETHVAYGVAPRISDCCLAANRDMILRVELRDRQGETGEDEERVLTGPCTLAGSSLCP